MTKTKTPPTVSKDLRTIRRLIVASLAIVLVLGAVFYTSSTTATNDIIKARAQGRITTCASDQAFELAHNRLVDANETFVSTILTDTARTKPVEQRPTILAYAKQRVAEYDVTKVPVRACDPASIKIFYQDHGTAQACPHGADGKGYCK